MVFAFYKCYYVDCGAQYKVGNRAEGTRKVGNVLRKTGKRLKNLLFDWKAETICTGTKLHLKKRENFFEITIDTK